MERALNQADLASALGQHAPGVLPTVEELTALIADVEIGAFRRDFGIDDELLKAAWYLHGVASAQQAEALYSSVRQRRAFRVSAHIFDLALASDTGARHTSLSLAFAAQVGYRRGELDPNATAVYRRVGDRLLDDSVGLVTHIDTLALEAGVLFLGLVPGDLLRLSRAWRRQFGALAGTVGVEDLRSTMFGPAQQVLLAVSSLFAYLRSGDVSQLEVARSALTSVITFEAGVGDHDARWVAAHLLHIADGMAEGSVWSVLPPGTPPAVAQAFTIGAPPVMVLWPPQRELLSRDHQNPLDPATRRLLMSVPTSAGKTLLAQLIICTHLATQPGDVCYVTPLRSLGREMRQALSSRLRILDRGLGADMPDHAGTGLDDLFGPSRDDPRGSVEVMTPERLMHLLRRDPSEVTDRFSLFVVDEAHLLAQPGRGFLLEGMLAQLASVDCRLVLLSGVLGNAGALASWLDPGTSDVLYTSQWRGPRRLHALLYSRPLWDRAERSPRKSRDWPTKVTTPMIAELRLRPAEAHTASLVTSDSSPLGSLVQRESLDGARERILNECTPFYRIVAAASAMLLHAGSLLMVVSTRLRARDNALALAEQVPPSSRSRDLVAFLIDRLGSEHPLVACARHGVAFHHAGLPVDVLDAIEEGLRTEQLDAVVATSTLTDGVNLPVRTVVIAETTWEGQPASSQLTAPRLLNAIGRAGRANRETEGWIVLALSKAHSPTNFDQLSPAAEALEANSTLTDDEALVSLAAAEALLAETADAVFELDLGLAADFVAYVWFVLSTLERLSRAAATRSDLEAAVSTLLGIQQLPAQLRRRWLALADQVQRAYTATDPLQRRRWASAGTSLGTARRLDQISATLVTELGRTRWHLVAAEPAELSLEATLDLFDQMSVFEQLISLPEADGLWAFKPTPTVKTTIEVPIGPAVRYWLSGLDIPELARTLMPALTNTTWRLEQTVDAITSVFEHHLSWTVGALLEDVNTRLEEANLAVRLRRDTAWCIRHGVDTPLALILLTNGIRSRGLAHRIGQAGMRAGIPTDGLREWLTDLHIQGWKDQFHAGPREILDLLEFTRARQQSLLRTLLEHGQAEITVQSGTGRDQAEAGKRADQTVAQPATIKPAGEAPAELHVIVDGVHVAVVAAAHHADVDAVLSSGLDVVMHLQDATLIIRDTEHADTAPGAGPDTGSGADPAATNTFDD